MGEAHGRDWTRGPAKWAAVVVLGTASLGGLAWSIRRGTVPVAPVSAASAESNAGSEVPEPDPPSAAGAAPEAAPAAPTIEHAARRLNINTASAAELETLPGIGPALAGRIIADRERHGRFGSIDDLDRVPGIGPRTILRLRDLVSVE